MSLSTNMQTLIEEKALLQAQLEVQEQNSASRIKDLEQKVIMLQLDKRLSARKPDDQAFQPAMATGSSDAVLRAENAQLRGQIAAKEGEVSEVLGVVRNYREVFDKVEKGFTASATALRSIRKEIFDKLSQSVVEDIHNMDRQSATETKESSSDTEENLEEADLYRSHHPTLSLESHTEVSHQPASTSFAAETESTLRASDLEEDFRWPGRMGCAFMTESANRSTGPIGDPFQAMNGWAVDLEVDAGRHGRPNISLHFSINKGKKDEPVSRKLDRRTEFAVTWRTGVVDDQRPMIEAFEAVVVSDDPRIEMPNLRVIVDKRPDKTQQDLTNLIAITFKSNSVEKPEFSATTKKLWRGLPTDVQQSLDILFFIDEPRWVTIWFFVDSTPELAMSSWISALHRTMNRS